MSRRAWVAAAVTMVGGAVGAVVLRDRSDEWAYYEVRLPAVPIVVAGALAVLIVAASLLASHAAAAASARVRRTVAGEAVDAARTERSQLIRRLDHEIKNPVTAIRAGVANVTVADLPEGARDAITSIDEQAVRLSRLVGDLRKLDELESAPIERSAVDLAEIVDDVAAAFSDLPNADGRTLQVLVPEVPWKVGAVAGDPDLVFLAVMNLVSNALKFSAAGDRIELRALEEDRHAVIEVADTGIGIPPAELPHVWEELARGDAARSVPGSGIGLALVKTIVERHGGEVSIRSIPEQGTVVRLRFDLGAP